MAGALQYLESQRDAQPELADWYNALADLYQRKLWHQLTVKLEQFVALAVVQVVPCCYSAGDVLIQLYHNFIMEFETKINLLKLAHFAGVISRQYSEKEAAISYLEGIIEKLLATKELRIEEPILYVKMQIAAFYLEKGSQKECKKLLEEGKSMLDSMTDVDPTVHANYYWISSQYHKSRQEFAEFYKSALLYLAYTSVESLSAPFRLVTNARTVRYRAVPPKINRRRSIEGEEGKKKKWKRRKNKRRRRTYFPRDILARTPLPPAGCPRAFARERFFSFRLLTR
ncbi:hypothetical protein BHM03_00025308 [Ensete ventricosum]|nr:hypothetical protein BHM03_00025308 [Ensete ventricosum]